MMTFADVRHEYGYDLAMDSKVFPYPDHHCERLVVSENPVPIFIRLNRCGIGTSLSRWPNGVSYWSEAHGCRSWWRYFRKAGRSDFLNVNDIVA